MSCLPSTFLQDWSVFVAAGDRLTVVEAATCDRNYVLREFFNYAHDKEFVYYWSPIEGLQRVAAADEDNQVRLEPLDPDAPVQPPTLNAQSLAQIGFADLGRGLYVVDGLLGREIAPELQQQIQALYFKLHQALDDRHVVLLTTATKIPLNLHPLLPKVRYAAPDPAEVKAQVAHFCWKHFHWEQTEDIRERQRPLVQALLGLPRAEIDIALRRGFAHSDQIEAIAQSILDYKQRKLQGRGITLLPQPDVEVVAGMDVLDETMEQIRLLLQPEARDRNLRPPKAMLLWGIPGTGKSLAAKLAAKRIGGSMVAVDWNGLIDSSLATSMDNLNHLLNLVSEMGNGVLFFDEFEKAFAGWNSSIEGGVLGKMTARLLSWMNDHTEPVIMIAAINHLEWLPPEMIRRFEIIHFFGMPHAGALHDIFKVHLDQYFRYQFTVRQWRLLLREYRGCTPAEVMKAVKAVADRKYVYDMRHGTFRPERPTVTVEELIEERQAFTPASAQRDISDAIAGILNRADYAKPVQGEDTSIFATPPETLMGVDEDAVYQATENTTPHRIASAKMEDL